MRERRVSGPWAILQVSTNYAIWLRIKGPHANTPQIVFQGMLMCYSETGKLLSLLRLQVSTRSQTAFPVMGKGWLRPAGGHSCDLRGFSNPDSSRKSVLWLAAVLQLWWGTKDSPRRQLRLNQIPRSQLLSLLQNTEVFSGSIRLHQIGVFFQTVAWESFDLFAVLYLLCAFLWASVQGQSEAWVRRGKESINSKRAGVYYHVFRQQISLLGTYHGCVILGGSGRIMSNYVCDLSHFFCLPGEALTAPYLWGPSWYPQTGCLQNIF